MSTPRLAFVDLDDTLLGPDKQVRPANRAALGRLPHLIFKNRERFNAAGERSA